MKVRKKVRPPPKTYLGNNKMRRVFLYGDTSITIKVDRSNVVHLIIKSENEKETRWNLDLSLHSTVVAFNIGETLSDAAILATEERKRRIPSE